MKKLWSIFADDMDHCIYTGSPYIERHHVFGGSRKDASEKRGFIAPLRYDLHPNGVSFHRTPDNLKIDGMLKKKCMEYYLEHYGTLEDFRREFGRTDY